MDRYALVIFESPKTFGGEVQRAWQSAILRAESIAAKNTTVETPAAGVHLIPLHSELNTFRTILAAAADFDVRTHTLFFDHKPSFSTS